MGEIILLSSAVRLPPLFTVEVSGHAGEGELVFGLFKSPGRNQDARVLV
jgi:hypothetical protein